MFYLFLAILCSSSIALIFKYSEGNNLNRYAVTSTNYFAAFVVSLFMIIKNRIITYDTLKDISFKKFGQELLSINNFNGPTLSNSSSLLWAILVGIIAGVFFFLSFIYYQKSVRKNGAGLSGTFAKLGILVPMIVSIVLWNEMPEPLQWVGIFLSLISIILVNINFKKISLKDFHLNLLLLFFLGGMAEFSNKIFQKYALSDFKDVFLFFVFFTAFLISLSITAKSKLKISKRDIFTGIAVGIPNLFSSFFLILALNSMAASVAYPIYSAGSIVLINLGGLLIFKEHLKKKEVASIIMTIVALILINM